MIVWRRYIILQSPLYMIDSLVTPRARERFSIRIFHPNYEWRHSFDLK